MGQKNKLAKKKLQQKRAREHKRAERAKQLEIRRRLAEQEEKKLKQEKEDDEEKFEIEYVTARPDTSDMPEFAEVFDRFESMAADDGAGEVAGGDGEPAGDGAETMDADENDGDEKKNVGDYDGDDGDGQDLSNKAKKRLKRQHVGALKQLAPRPDLVEVWDATAPDPEFLVFLKGYRNSVPVPIHWQQKRKYLQGKRSVDKKPFELPEYIAATGIQRLREAYVERENAKKARASGRERMQPKMGKLDIDYQVLHDAFFKHQTKPRGMTGHGELYYEGKEHQVKVTQKRPGFLSNQLREALGLPVTGAGVTLTPLPWVHNMQRFGPPPSYPRLKIPGVNAPLPEGGQWGYQQNGWGKPPVDAWGRPLYGDVFGVAKQAAAQAAAAAITAAGTPQQEELQRAADEAARLAEQVSGQFIAPVVEDRPHWGDIEVEDDESDEEESESESESDAESGDDEGPGAKGGEADDLASVASVASVPSVASVQSTAHVPATVDLRKRRPGVDADDDDGATAPKQLYTVLEQKAANVSKGELFGVSHQYVVPGKDNNDENN